MKGPLDTLSRIGLGIPLMVACLAPPDGAAPAAPASWAASVTTNSLVGADVSQSSYGGVGLVPGDSATLVRATVTVNAGPTYTLNIARNCAANERTGRPFKIPPGTTSLDCKVTVALYAGDVTEALTWRVTKPDGTTVLKTSSCAGTTPGTVYTMNTVPGDGWAVGDVVYIQPLVNEDGRQARVIVSGIQVIPNGATGIFADFVCVDVDPRTVSNAIPGDTLTTNFGRGSVYSPFATIAANTNATSFVVRSWSSLVATDTAGTPNPFAYSAQNAALSVRIGAVGAVPAIDQRIDAAASIELQHATVTSAALDGTTKRVEIVMGHWALKSSASNHGLTPYTSTVDCIFFARSASVTPLPDTLTGNALAVLGDSILSGAAFNAADQPTANAAVVKMRYGEGAAQFNGRVYSRACGSSKVEDWLGQAGDTTKADYVAGLFTAIGVTHCINGLQSNSGRDGIDKDIHYRCRRQFADSFHTARPSAWMVDVAAFQRTGFEEGTLDQLREQTWMGCYSAGLTSPGGAADVAHNTWMTWGNGATQSGLTTADTDDGVHFKATKQAALATWLMSLVTAGYVAPPTWHPYQKPGIGIGVLVDGGATNHKDGSNNITALDDGAGTSAQMVPNGATGPLYVATGWPDGTPCARTIAARGMKSWLAGALYQFNYGYQQVEIVGKCTVAGEVAVKKNDGVVYLYGTTGNSMNIRLPTGAGITSAKDIAVNWMADSAIHLWEWSFMGTHVSHKVYRDGAAMATSDVTVGDPLGTQDPGALYLFASDSNAFGASGDWKLAIFSNHQSGDAYRTKMRTHCQTNFGTP